MQKAKKSLSQNFLIDKNICKKIVKEADIKNKNILEIGPGKGVLTEFILNENPRKLILIEKDDKLFKYLKKKYDTYNNVRVINYDILDYEINNLKNINIISNLPYNISTKIILKLFKSHNIIDKMVLMLQKEVAEKFEYKNSKYNKYNFLNNLLCNYKICFIVKPNSFKPVPKVISAVVKFEFKINDIDFNKINLFIKKIFHNKRKIIGNKLKLESSELKKLQNKRIDEMNFNEILKIYDFF